MVRNRRARVKHALVSPRRIPYAGCGSGPRGAGGRTMTPMLRKIERDVKRFRQIVRGVVKKDFRKYLTQGELIGRQGRHVVSIPLPQIEIPRFRFGEKESGGVGSGEGGRGDAVEGAPGTEDRKSVV